MENMRDSTMIQHTNSVFPSPMVDAWEMLTDSDQS